jgi:hypothetical protein
LNSDDYPGRGVPLGCAKPADIFKMILSKSRKIAEAESRCYKDAAYPACNA